MFSHSDMKLKRKKERKRKKSQINNEREATKYLIINFMYDHFYVFV